MKNSYKLTLILQFIINTLSLGTHTYFSLISVKFYYHQFNDYWKKIVYMMHLPPFIIFIYLWKKEGWKEI